MNKRHKAAIVWLALLALAASYVLLGASVRNDMTSFMPQAATPEQRLLLNELRTGPVARLMLLTLAGASPERLAEVSKQVAARLRASDRFLRVANGEQPFDKDELERLREYRYLLSPAVDADRFSVDGLRESLDERLRELASPLPTLDRRWLAEDPTAELRAVVAAWRDRAGPRLYAGVWFDVAGARALMLAQTRAAGFDLDAQQRAQEAIREAVEETGGEEVTLAMSGPGVFAVTSRAIIRADIRRLGILAAVVAVVILLVSYRSVRLLVIGGLPLVSAVLAGIAAVSLIFGSIHGIVLAFGVTVIGVAIDYPIHLFSHLHAGETVRRTLDAIWPTIRLGAITTAIGYLAMTDSDFPGLAQFATFAIAGLLAAAACTRWGLAGLLPEVYAPLGRSRLAAWYARARRPGMPWVVLAIAAGLASLVYLAVYDESPWQDDVAAMSPIAESVMARDRDLHAELGVPDTNHLLLIRAPDAQSALRVSEEQIDALQRLVADGIITRFDLAARYLPSVRTQLARRAHLPSRERLAANLNRALDGTPFKPDAFTPFQDAVAQARRLAPLEPSELGRTALGARVRSGLLPVDGEWVALITLSGVRDAVALRDWIGRATPPELSYLDLKRDTERLMRDFREHAFVRAAVGLLAIGAVLWLGLRSMGRTARVLLPGLLAVAVDVAVLRLLGERLSLFHLVSMLLVVGISIDYSLFFSRDDRDPGMRGRTFHGLAVCALSTVSVFAILATSELPVLEAIGTTVAVGVAASFLAALALAPPAPERGPGDRP